MIKTIMSESKFFQLFIRFYVLQILDLIVFFERSDICFT